MRWPIRWSELLENPGNRGKGYSVRNGMLHARGAVALFTDADLSSPITEADKLFAALAEGADVAHWVTLAEARTADRAPAAASPTIRAAVQSGLQLVLGLDYRDTQCGFKAFNRQAIQTIFTRQRIERWGFDPELLFLARKFNLKTVEVPVEWAHDHRSKISPLRDGLRMGIEVIKIRWNDLMGRYKRPAMELSDGGAAPPPRAREIEPVTTDAPSRRPQAGVADLPALAEPQQSEAHKFIQNLQLSPLSGILTGSVLNLQSSSTNGQ